MQITLPSGKTASFRDVHSITQGERKLIMLLSVKVARGQGDENTTIEVTDRIIALLLAEWDYDLPLPSEDLGSLDKISGYDYDALSLATRDVKVFLDTKPTPDADSPTVPSSA